MNFEPVAVAHTAFTDLFGIPRQGALTPSSRGRIELIQPYRDRGFLEGLEGFSHVWLLWVFHRNKNKVIAAKANPPRLNGGKVGVFAARSPHRPNPIGLSCCEIIRVGINDIEIKSHDLVDQTPILDIKPYIPEYDSFPRARNGWLAQNPLAAYAVHFSQQFFSSAENLGIEPKSLVPLIKECLEHDPRPLIYRQMEARIHTLALAPWDIDFRGTDQGFIVEDIRPFVAPSEREQKSPSPTTPQDLSAAPSAKKNDRPKPQP